MKIICIGRNYAEHIKELNNETPEEPLIFMKPDSALVRNNDPFVYPAHSKDVHFEVEIVVKINQPGKFVAPEFADRYYDEIGLGVDFTARDVQAKLKAKGLPWELAKGFNGSAVISNFLPKTDFADVQNINFSLAQNGELKQSGNTSMMITSINAMICYVSQYFSLKIGDLLYTGTPAGVGPVAIGDCLEGYIEDRKMFRFFVK